MTLDGLIETTFFQSSNRLWRDYINDLHKTLNLSGHKAFFSKVGIPSYHDFEITFRDYQLVQRLHQQLLRAQCLLELSAESARRCETGRKRKLINDLVTFQDYIHQVEVQKRVLERLLATSDRILQTFSQILQYRSDESSLKTNETIQQQTEAIVQLTKVSLRESETLALLSRKAQEDTRMVKVLTIVASFYLPAALVASVFNSNLVQTVSSSKLPSKDLSIEVTSQFWLFPVFTLVLMLATLAPAAVWIRYTSKKAAVAKASP